MKEIHHTLPHIALNITLVLLTLFVGPCSTPHCDLSSDKIVEALNRLHQEKLLELLDDHVFVTFSDELEFQMPEQEIQIGNRAIQLVNKSQILPKVRFLRFLPDSKSHEYILYFQAEEGAYRCQGEIVYECVDQNLKLTKLNYITAQE